MNTILYNKKTNDPQAYYWFQGALSKDEVNSIIELANKLPESKRASVISDDTGGGARSSMIKWLPRSEDFNWLYARMIEMSEEANNELWDFDLYSSLEDIQYTEYYASENGHYDWHQDIGVGEFPSKRKISITIQLSDSDEYEGGDLLICTGSSGSGELDHNIVSPRGAGVGVLFPSYMMHRVTPVTRGVRRSLVLWVGGAHFK